MKFKVPDLYRVEKIFGPPGTGKTYELLKILRLVKVLSQKTKK